MNIFDECDENWEEDVPENWTEFDWQRFMQEAEKSVARFQNIYNQLDGSQLALEETAYLMGWTRLKMPKHLERFRNPKAAQQEQNLLLNVHHHPAMVITSGLYADIESKFQEFMDTYPRLPSLWIWWWCKCLGQGKRFGSMAMMALEMNDPGLCCCYLKYGLRSLNDQLTCLSILPDRLAGIDELKEQIQKRLFDVRETWLRLLDVCRIETNQRQGDAE